VTPPSDFGSTVLRPDAGDASRDAARSDATALPEATVAPDAALTSQLAALPEAPAPASAAPGRCSRAHQWVLRHETVLWWVHSAWALVFGIGMMWLGARDFRYLRLAFVQVGFIWVSSLLLPRLARSPRLGPGVRERARQLVNYFNRNFYQQVLFFVLPVYWGSITPGSVNVLFVVLVAFSALVATLDVFYDRHLSVRAGLAGVFFAFNLFVCANVALPVLWSVSNARAMRASALLAIVGFATLALRGRHLRRGRVLAAVLVAALSLLGLLEWGRRVIPPAPLRLAETGFGTGVDRATRTLVGRKASVPAGWTGTLIGFTAIRAPLGLSDRVRHRWTAGGSQLRTTPYYVVSGGREQGFRLWTAVAIPSLPRRTVVQLDVETEGGQLIGRVRLPVE